jgi:RNA polymerase sigma-70 factor, ECF subfamily
MMQFVQDLPKMQVPTISQIVLQHYESVFRFCALRVGAQGASDVTQETFLTAQRVLSNFEGRSDLKIWLLGIAHNECRRYSRNERRHPNTGELSEPLIESGEHTIIDRETVRSALAKLSPEHREVVFLREWDGLSYDEIGQILGIPSGTVKSRLHHAFLQLRRHLEPSDGVKK